MVARGVPQITSPSHRQGLNMNMTLAMMKFHAILTSFPYSGDMDPVLLQLLQPNISGTGLYSLVLLSQGSSPNNLSRDDLVNLELKYSSTT